MGVSIEYGWSSTILSAIALLLATIYAIRVIRSYQRYHDERAAVNLAKSIGLWVISLGLLISASGLILHQPTMAVTGLSLSRGAFLVLMATLVLADVRPRGDRGEKEATT